MPYDELSENFITESSESSDYLLGFSDSDSFGIRDSVLSSGTEQSGTGSVSSEADEDQEYNSDYSDILGYIYSDTSLCVEQTESLVIQLDNLNENVVTLNENLKIGIGLLFVLVVIFSIKVIFAIFNKILGFGQA